MHFNHGYTILGESGGKIKLRNPHGKTDKKERNIFSKKVKEALEALPQIGNKIIENFPAVTILEEEKKELEKHISVLKDFKDNFESILNKWAVLKKEIVPQEKGIWSLTKKGTSLFKEMAKAINVQLKTDKVKGFVEQEIEIEAVQEVSYNVLQENFYKLTISIIQ